MDGTQGILSLGDLAITAAGTFLGPELADLNGMSAVTLQLRFAYGSGGTTVDAFVQTSLDQGTTSVNVWHEQFATAADMKIVNVSGLTPVTTPVLPADGALAPGTVLDGVLGDRLRLKAVVAGTYAGSTVLSGRAAVR